MKVEHQGEGSYTYYCADMDCFFCKLRRNDFKVQFGAHLNLKRNLNKPKINSTAILDTEPIYHHPAPKNDWSEYEVEFLKKNFNMMSLSRLAMKLNRKKTNISYKADQLSLGKKSHVKNDIVTDETYAITENFNGWF